MFASREAQNFLESLDKPDEVQDRFLEQHVLAPNRDCEFGRRYGFDKVQSLADYRKAVPILKYDGFADLIERTVQHGEQGLVTGDPIKRFFLTSGSTSKSKYIPVTNRFVRNKSRTFGIYWSLVFGSHPAAKAGRMVCSTSWARLAMYRSISHRRVMSSSRWSRRAARIFSPISVPPGSRTSQGSSPASRAASRNRRSWVDLPEPSGPSKTRNRPLRARASAGSSVRAGEASTSLSAAAVTGASLAAGARR